MQKTYSLRAECKSDADQLKKLVSKACANSEVFLTPDAKGLPDQEIKIHTELEFEEVLELIRSINDGHVMLQTLQPVPLSENSLERDYDRVKRKPTP